MKICTVYSNRSEKAGLLKVCVQLESLEHTVHTLDALEDDSPADKFNQLTSRVQDAIIHDETDMLLVYGDRYEQLAAACVAHVMRVPIAHIHGGELSLGSFDNATRHALSMMADIHFTATHDAAQRLLRFGVDPNRIWVTGSPALDKMVIPTVSAFEENFGFDPGFMVLVAYHPDSLTGEEQPDALFRALARQDAPVLFTAPNGEPGSDRIRDLIADYIIEDPQSRFEENLGGFFRTAMANCEVMVGNSSAGIIEAPSMGCPFVNVGRRQEGRQQAWNVVNAGMDEDEILNAMREAMDMPRQTANPYFKDDAAGRIAMFIDAINDKNELLRR